jgi:hypothetical protein
MVKFSKEGAKRRFTSIHAWELPKETGALAPPHVWVCVIKAERAHELSLCCEQLSNATQLPDQP